MQLVNTDDPTHRTKDPARCLHEAERGEKRMCLEPCLQQRRHFSTFVASVDGLLGLEAMATLKRLASRMATKWKQYYSKTCGYVKSKIAITLMRATTAAYEDPGCRHTGSVCSVPSGRMAQA